jgi:hypothetical protein
MPDPVSLSTSATHEIDAPTSAPVSAPVTSLNVQVDTRQGDGAGAPISDPVFTPFLPPQADQGPTPSGAPRQLSPDAPLPTLPAPSILAQRALPTKPVISSLAGVRPITKSASAKSQTQLSQAVAQQRRSPVAQTLSLSTPLRAPTIRLTRRPVDTNPLFAGFSAIKGVANAPSQLFQDALRDTGRALQSFGKVARNGREFLKGGDANSRVVKLNAQDLQQYAQEDAKVRRERVANSTAAEMAGADFGKKSILDASVGVAKAAPSVRAQAFQGGGKIIDLAETGSGKFAINQEPQARAAKPAEAPLARAPVRPANSQAPLSAELQAAVNFLKGLPKEITSRFNGTITSQSKPPQVVNQMSGGGYPPYRSEGPNDPEPAWYPEVARAGLSQTELQSIVVMARDAEVFRQQANSIDVTAPTIPDDPGSTPAAQWRNWKAD